MSTIDWANLGFGYMKTDFNVRCYYRNGKWGEIEASDSEYIPLHIAATALHYGQEAFEGLKAFRGKDGQIRIFRLEDNALRMQSSSRGILMAEVRITSYNVCYTKLLRDAPREDVLLPFLRNGEIPALDGRIGNCVDQVAQGDPRLLNTINEKIGYQIRAAGNPSRKLMINPIPEIAAPTIVHESIKLFSKILYSADLLNSVLKPKLKIPNINPCH